MERVRNIVRALKDFAHTDNSDTMITFDLNAALESTLTVARNELKNVADVATDFGDLPHLLGSPGELNQVFLNLLVNAANAIRDKRSGQRETISLSTRRADDWVVVSIGDTGCGIAEAIRDKIFDPFFTTKDVGNGTGQGLAISRNIVAERHNGRIDLESEEGVGTTLHIWLPLTAAAADPNPGQHANPVESLEMA